MLELGTLSADQFFSSLFLLVAEDKDDFHQSVRVFVCQINFIKKTKKELQGEDLVVILLFNYAREKIRSVRLSSQKKARRQMIN